MTRMKCVLFNVHCLKTHFMSFNKNYIYTFKQDTLDENDFFCTVKQCKRCCMTVKQFGVESVIFLF